MRSKWLIVLLIGAFLGGCDKGGDDSGKYALTTTTRSETWTTSYGDGKALTTPHYQIFTTVTRPQLIQVMPGFMEAAYRRYGEVTGLSLRQSSPMPIYMLATRKEWADLTTEITQENAKIYLSISAGGYCYRGTCVFWDIGGNGVLSLSSHEGLHQFLSTRLKDHIPNFLEEGLCSTMEGFDIQSDTVTFTPSRNLQRMDNLRSVLVNGPWVDLHNLLQMDAGDAIGDPRPGLSTGYYCQLWALAMFIQSKPQYRQGMQRLLADASAGRVQSQLGVDPGRFAQLRRNGREYNRTLAIPIFRHYFTEDIKGFEREYRRFAYDLVGME